MTKSCGCFSVDPSFTCAHQRGGDILLTDEAGNPLLRLTGKASVKAKPECPRGTGCTPAYRRECGALPG